MSEMQSYGSGATRSSDEDKLDYEGFLSPSALQVYAEYLHSHRKQADGKFRDSDNWQNGVPPDRWMKSLLRHAMDTWLLHRGHEVCDRNDGHLVTLPEALCATIFNAFGYLHVLSEMEPYIDFACTLMATEATIDSANRELAA